MTVNIYVVDLIHSVRKYLPPHHDFMASEYESAVVKVTADDKTSAEMAAIENFIFYNCKAIKKKKEEKKKRRKSEM